MRAYPGELNQRDALKENQPIIKAIIKCPPA